MHTLHDFMLAYVLSYTLVDVRPLEDTLTNLHELNRPELGKDRRHV